MNTVPLFNLAAQYTPSLRRKILQDWKVALATTAFMGNPAIEKFEKKFAQLCKTPTAVGVKSGTAGLLLALKALEVGPGDEVITTANTFAATADVISLVGGVPIFADSSQETGNLEATEIAKKITKKTKVIVVVHLYGVPSEMDDIIALAKKHRLTVIEDASHAHGSLYKNRPVGSIGDIGCFSLYPAKTLGATGDAGVVVSNDPKLVKKIKMLADHGREPGGDKYTHQILGFNERIDALQAIALNAKLPLLKTWIDRKRTIADIYNQTLQKCGHPGMVWSKNTQPSLYVYAIQVSDREKFRRFCDKRGVVTGVYYPIPLHLQPSFAFLKYKKGSLPQTEIFAQQTVSLPLYPELTSAQIKQVCQTLEAYFG